MNGRVLGIIGPSGSGKSTLRALFEEGGALGIDGDALARQVLSPGAPCLQALAATFGDDVLDASGAINRARLASRAFASPEGVERLNRITHPPILEKIDEMIAENRARLAVVDGAALLESGFAARCEAIICVLAARQTRLARIKARDGLGDREALARIAAQPEDGFYKAAASHVLYNNDEGAFLSAGRALVARLMGEVLP